MSEKENVKTDDVKDDAVEKDQEEKAQPKKKPAPKKAKKGMDADEVLVKNTIEINPKLEEAKGATTVVGWGRMNPITSGHEKLVNKIKDVARKEGATPHVFLTHSQDAKKNPLSYDDKVMLARRAFGAIIQKSKAKTIIQAMQELQKKYSKVILVVGADRIKEFETLLNKYNGKDYSFDSIQVVSAGERADPDSEEAKTMTADAMSASVMRKLASQGDFETFKKGLPKGLMRNAQDVYDMVRGGMKIAEELEELEEALSFSQRRQRAMTMRKYKSKIAAARKRMAKRVSSKDRLQKKARKKAIAIIRGKVAGEKGKNYSNLSPAEKMMIDQKVAKRKAVIDRIAKKMLPKVRKADIARVQGKKVTESFDAQFEAFIESYETTPTKRFHQMMKKDGSIKLDGRFKVFRSKQELQKKAIDENSAYQDAESRLKTQHSKERENLKREHESEMDALQARGLRKQIRDLKKEDIDFESDAELMNMIESVTQDILESIELEESKALAKLIEKSEQHGIEYETLEQVFKEALQEEPRGDLTPQQHAFATVNVFLANKKDDVNEEIGLEESVDELFEKYTDHDKWGMKRLKSITINKKKYDHALNVLKDIVKRKKDEKGAHGSMYYAAQVAKQYKGVDARTLFNMLEEAGAGEEGTDELVKKYKKDTPHQDINEDFEALFEEVTYKQIQDLEKFADRLLDKFGVDVEFTRHFADRMNDERNNPAISVAELQRFFKKVAKNKAKEIKQSAGSEAVLKDIQADLNLPVVIKYNKAKDEIEVVNKTIMRKKNFATSNKVITYK